MAVNERATRYLVEQARQAADLGHKARLETRDRSEEFPDSAMNVKYWAVCSCGYTSTARATQSSALAALFTHVGKVTGTSDKDNRRRRADGGVSLTGIA